MAVICIARPNSRGYRRDYGRAACFIAWPIHAVKRSLLALVIAPLSNTCKFYSGFNRVHEVCSWIPVNIFGNLFNVIQYQFCCSFYNPYFLGVFIYFNRVCMKFMKVITAWKINTSIISYELILLLLSLMKINE